MTVSITYEDVLHILMITICINNNGFKISSISGCKSAGVAVVLMAAEVGPSWNHSSYTSNVCHLGSTANSLTIALNTVHHKVAAQPLSIGSCPKRSVLIGWAKSCDRQVERIVLMLESCTEPDVRTIKVLLSRPRILGWFVRFYTGRFREFYITQLL